MDPTRPESFNHRTELLSTGRTYHFIDQVPEAYDPKQHPTLLCIHGFPDLWYGWRYQIGPWVRRGCRVVVPDMLGYGGTSKPTSPEEYTTKKLCSDLAALLDLVGTSKAVVIGHDWGSFTAGRLALWHPKRLLALIMLSVPYTPPSRQFLPLTEIVKRAPNLGYQLYFADQKSTGDILANIEPFVRLLFGNPGSKSDWLDFTPTGALEKLLLSSSVPDDLPICLTEKERKYYIEQLSKDMNGPLNYYRTTHLRHEEELAAGLPARLPDNLPFLFMWGSEDSTSTEFVIAKSRKFIQRYQDIVIEGKGHWVMVEAKEEVTNRVIGWLEALMSTHPNHKPKL